MASEARRKREQLLEKKAAEEFAARLKSSRVLRFHGDGEIPSWVHSEIARIRKTDSVPQDSISCDVERFELLEWMNSFLRKSDIRGNFHISIGIQSMPWAEFKVLADDWLEELTEYRGYDIYFVSKNLERLVIFFEEECCYEAFYTTSTTQNSPASSSA